jgi:four helix bundle protein
MSHEARARGDGGDAIRSYRDLVAWQKAFELARLVYETTAGFPADETYGLKSQMRRSAVSTASNIAEGWGRGATQDFARFLRMARGSAYELETQTQIAQAVGLVGDTTELFQAIDEMTRVTNGLLRSVEKRIGP